MIDNELLSTILAEDAWEQETKMVKEQDLYEEEWEGGNEKNNWQGRYIQQVRSKWSYLFFMLKDGFKELIEECRVDTK